MSYILCHISEYIVYSQPSSSASSRSCSPCSSCSGCSRRRRATARLLLRRWAAQPSTTSPLTSNCVVLAERLQWHATQAVARDADRCSPGLQRHAGLCAPHQTTQQVEILESTICVEKNTVIQLLC